VGGFIEPRAIVGQATNNGAVVGQAINDGREKEVSELHFVAHDRDDTEVFLIDDGV
jgi:hypothetical protein